MLSRPMTAPDVIATKHPATRAGTLDEAVPPLSIASRGMLVLFAVGLSFGFCAGFLLLKDPLEPYLTNNEMRPSIRRFVLGVAFASGALAEVAGIAAAFRLRKVSPFSDTLQRIAYRSAPLGAFGFLPLLFNWRAWRGRDMEFLTLVAFAAVCLEVGMRARLSTAPLGPERFVEARARRVASDFTTRFPRVAARAPFVVVCGAALAYALYFSYVTIAWHYSVRSGYDLAIANNLLWNLVHGGPFFKSSPVLGPVGSYFGKSATPFAYALAPIYALYQRPETLYVVQATLLGAAAIPLFLYSRLYLGAAASCLLALAYLMFPGVHGTNLFEFHCLALSTFFVWVALYAVESRRDVLAVVAVILSLSTNEDVALWLIAIGLYLLVTARRPRAGLVMVVSATAYFVAMKLWLMPRFGAEGAASMYQRLLPTGEDGFGAVVETVIANPWYTLGTLLENDKVVYAMQMLVPLALVPLRRPLTLLLLSPALLLTTLSSYAPASSIHFQFSPHWTTFVFVATVLVLATRSRVARRGSLWALALATVACSYQYGAVLQRNTSSCGPLAFKFGVDREGRARHRGLAAVLLGLPPRAKVSCSAFTTPQVSSRADAYSLTIGLFDAKYVLFPTNRADFVSNEYQTISGLLQNKTFGVVTVAPPFALARKGEDAARNAEVLGMMR